MSRDPISVNNDNPHWKVLLVCQRLNDMDKDTQKDPHIFITGATVAVQQEERGQWTHGVIVEPDNNDQRGHSYII